MDSEIAKLLDDPAMEDSVKLSMLSEQLKSQSKSSVPYWRKLLQSGPMIAALASIFTVGITEISRGNLASADKRHERSLEELKFQFDVIRLALNETKSPENRAASLKFFTEIELLDGLNTVALEKWSEVDKVPSIKSEIESPFLLKKRLYTETIGIVRKMLSQADQIDVNSVMYLRFWELYKTDLIGVESRDVANAMISFGGQLKLIENDQTPAKDVFNKQGERVIFLMRGELESAGLKPVQ